MLRSTALLAIILFTSCASPHKALEKGQNKKAMRLAKSELRKAKNADQNITIFKAASQNEIDHVLASNTSNLSSPEVKDWIKTQNSYFSLLENIGEVNLMTQGELSEPYDRLCEHKTDLDYKIADHYYQQGEEKLQEYEETQKKIVAKSAYYNYNSALKYGADKYYQDINDKMEYCIKEGRVYYIAYDYDPSDNLFFKPLPSDMEQEPDCIIRSSRSGYSSSESRKTSQKNHEKKVEIGQESITDTAGVTTYYPIYDTVYAYQNMTETTITLSTTTWINVKNKSGQCPLRSRSFSNIVSDSYEEVTFTGDARAYPSFAKDETGPPSFFIRGLERKLDDEVENELGI